MNKRSKLIILSGVGALFVFIILWLAARAYLMSESQKGWEEVISVRIDSSFQKDTHGRIWYQVGSSPTIESLEGEHIQVPLQGEEQLYSFIFNPQGGVWTSTNAGLLIQDTGGVWNRYASPGGFDPIFRLLVVDGKGRAWARWGEEYNLSFIELNQAEMAYSFNRESTLTFGRGNFIPASVASDGNIWAIHDGNLITVSTEGTWMANSSISLPSANSMAFDGQGRIWIGGGQDLLRMVDQDISLSAFPSGVKDEPVRVEEVDQGGRVWGRIGLGYSGLYVFTPEEGGLVYTSENSGLPDDSLRDVTVDQAGGVWIATPNGIARFLPDQSSSSSLLVYSEFIRKGLPFTIPLLILLVTVIALAFTHPGAVNQGNLREFSLGFFGWLFLTILYFVGVNALSEAMGESGAALIVCFFIPPPVTLLALIIFWIKRRYIAIGIFSGVLVGLIALILYLFEVWTFFA